MFKILTKYILLHKKFAKFEQCIKKKTFSRIYFFQQYFQYVIIQLKFDITSIILLSSFDKKVKRKEN